MADAALGVLSLAVAAALGWLVRNALTTGQSVARYGLDSTRGANPVLFWFDVGATSAIALTTAAAGIALIW